MEQNINIIDSTINTLSIQSYLTRSNENERVNESILAGIKYSLADIIPVKGNDIELNKFKFIDSKIEAFLPQKTKPFREYSKETQSWLCFIIAIDYDNEIFTARLNDLIEDTTYEEADFFFNDVNPEDRKLIKLGAIFYWSVGYVNRGGQIIKQSFLRFQRLPKWDVGEYDAIIDNLSSVRKLGNWDDWND